MVTRTPTLSNRALCLMKIETTYNVDALPTPALDAYLVMNADVKINPNVLTRNFYKPSLSKLPVAIGRKLATISMGMEIKGSGRTGIAAKLGTALRACGFAQTTVTATAGSEVVNFVTPPANTSPAVTQAPQTVATKGFGRYKIKCVLGGASATAEVLVFGNPPDYNDPNILPEDDFSALVMGPAATTTITVNTTNPLLVTYTVGTPQIGDVVVIVVGGFRFKYTIGSATPATEATAIAALLVDPAAAGRFSAGAATSVVTVTVANPVVVTSGTTNIALGQSGATLQLTWTGSLVISDYWTVDVLKPGFHYTPISTGFESFTVYMYYDGTLHRLTGCIGTVKFNGPAGNYGTAEFTFTGQYNNPDDQPLPTTSVFELTQPQQVELAELAISNAKLMIAQSFTIDMGIAVNPRDSVSHPDGYNGVLYTSRDPKGTANPEMFFESEQPFWRQMAAATLMRFFARIGTSQFNIVEFHSDTVSLTGITYADRNNLRVEDLAFGFHQDSFNGDDEIRICFPNIV